jgi:AI-2 transport protein TqsA
MTQDPIVRTLLGLCAAVLIFAALEAARSLLAPVAFSLFIIAIVWPFQRRLQSRLPKLVALAVTILVILVVITALSALLVWGFSHIGQWVIANSIRFQALYMQAVDWLEGHGIPLVSQVTGSFNVSWLFRAVQEVGGRLSDMLTFVVITLVFTILGLLEVDIAKKNIARLESREIARSLLDAGTQVAAKFQKYMLVRTIMSVLTGAVIWAIALLAGLELATAWGVIAFVFNYIPFIGPLFATVFPTLFALAQFESWQLALIVLVCLNLVQFLIGSYLEPRIAGATLSISPFLILLAVFFWSSLWGIAGAFIGIPIVIAVLTICEQHESTRWVATLLSGRDRAPAQPPPQ